MKVEMNKYQTPITEELLETIPKEVQDQLFDILNNVEFVKRLISSKICGLAKSTIILP